MMSDTATRLLTFAGFLLLVPVAGCEQRPPVDWTPVLESTSTSYLRDEMDQALSRLSTAREALPSDPQEAIQTLEAAESDLHRLRDVYLPLLDARERAYNAYRLHYLGRDSEAASELEEIRTTLLDVSRDGGEALLVELERIQELVADARIELEAESPTATRGLRELAVELDDFMNRAGIFLDDRG